MPLAQDVVDRLLVAKGLLERIRSLPAVRPDRISLARAILAAHDAAELALAAVAQHLGRLPTSANTYLMNYFPSIQDAHPDRPVVGREYFSQLNRVRTDVKHHGIFPDVKQWYRVGERTYDYVSDWCQEYLGFSLDDLDESAMLADSKAKEQYDAAVTAFHAGDHKGSLEHLALATNALFKSNAALRNLGVGTPRAEDAIKLATFGVHANDYLALQEFLPKISYAKGQPPTQWEQEKYGHPANWTKPSVEFAMRTFVHVAIRIQDAEWIPGAIDFHLVYEHKVTALVDGVEIVQEQRPDLLKPPKRIVVRRLSKGESIRCHVSRKGSFIQSALEGKEHKPIFILSKLDEILFGEVEAENVRVTCVPREHDFVRQYFPDLPEIDYGS